MATKREFSLKQFFTYGGYVLIAWFAILLIATFYQASDNRYEIQDTVEVKHPGYETPEDMVKICASPAAESKEVPVWSKILGWVLFFAFCLLAYLATTLQANRWIEKNINAISFVSLLLVIVLIFVARKQTPYFQECKDRTKAEYLLHQNDLEKLYKSTP